MSEWHVRSGQLGSIYVGDLLRDGWEPFSASGDYVYLRLESTPVVDEVEGHDTAHDFQQEFPPGALENLAKGGTPRCEFNLMWDGTTHRCELALGHEGWHRHGKLMWGAESEQREQFPPPESVEPHVPPERCEATTTRLSGTPIAVVMGDGFRCELPAGHEGEHVYERPGEQSQETKNLIADTVAALERIASGEVGWSDLPPELRKRFLAALWPR